jgi:hypothetical protein
LSTYVQTGNGMVRKKDSCPLHACRPQDSRVIHSTTFWSAQLVLRDSLHGTRIVILATILVDLTKETMHNADIGSVSFDNNKDFQQEQGCKESSSTCSTRFFYLYAPWYRSVWVRALNTSNGKTIAVVNHQARRRQPSTATRRPSLPKISSSTGLK